MFKNERFLQVYLVMIVMQKLMFERNNEIPQHYNTI